MKEIKVKNKISFIFNIIGIFLIFIAIYLPINEAISQFFKTVNIKLDFLVLIEPYMIAFLGSILILLSAMFTSRRFKLTLLFFLIQNLPMAVFFIIMITQDSSINLSDIYFKNNILLYILYILYSIGSLLMVGISIALIMTYDIKLKEIKPKNNLVEQTEEPESKTEEEIQEEIIIYDEEMLKKITVKNLVKIARQRKLRGYSRLRKAELINFILERQE